MSNDRPRTSWDAPANPIADLRGAAERLHKATLFSIVAENERIAREENELRWMKRAYDLYGPSLEPTEL